MQNIGSVLGAAHQRPLIAVYESYGLSTLAAWRLAAPMTRQILSSLSGIPAEAIGEIERREREATPFEAIRLARSLGAEPEEFHPRSRLCET